ncbi:hypothetical protein [Streptomyces sp. ML-6]|uniref:hypothetical protein n=1 Tax=unclassified Streptomyces TaxID=2593676 RepID=UPI0024C07482|nr:hypothetical protein [Streptomyces sp. ML-6]MDK0521760.1 hypothetical protein [Streptomyces sp. ML-6]
MKPLLWLVLCIALVANLLLNLMADNTLHIVLSVVTGSVVLASGTGLWLRHRAERA